MVSYFSELGCFDLNERRIVDFCELPGDFCFATSSGANHENIFGNNGLPDLFLLNLESAPAVSVGDGNGSFGGDLGDDVFVENVEYLFGSIIFH